MASDDHYEVLGVSSKASTEEVKRAYRSLSRQFHPDKAGPDMDEAAKEASSKKMIALNIAYQVLMSPQERRNFDLSREPPAKENASAQNVSSTCAGHSSYAAASAARRAASWGRPSASRPSQPPAPAPPNSTSVGSKASAQTPSADVGSTRAGNFIAASNAPKPRYQNGGKYSQRARQARRMDPSQYTTHIDGRAHEFEAAAEDFLQGLRGESGLGSGVPTATAPTSSATGASEPGVARYPTWLQRQLDVAKKWEEINCPAEPEQEKYQWRKASDNWLRNLRERKSAREQMSEDAEVSAL